MISWIIFYKIKNLYIRLGKFKLFNPNPHWVLFILNRYGIRGPSLRLTPKQFSLEYSARIARTDGRILLVDSRELREPATCFYWSTGRENRQPTSICRQVERMIQMRAIRKTHLQWVGQYMPNFDSLVSITG
jgi:hypothetical protein